MKKTCTLYRDQKKLQSFLPLTYPHFLIESQPYFLQFLCKGNEKKKKKQQPVQNSLNHTIVNQMQHTRDLAVVTKDRDNTMIHERERAQQ